MIADELAKPIIALNLIFGEPAYAGNRPPAIGDRNGNHDFIASRRIADANLHAVEVTTDKRRILMSERNVQRHAQAAALFRGRDQRGSFPDELAHWRSEFRMESRSGVFNLPVFADRRRFSITLNFRRSNAGCCNGGCVSNSPSS